MTFGDFNLVSRDAAAALTVFSSEFDQALELRQVNEWARKLGACLLINSSKSIKTTYPIPVSAAKYVLREGDFVMRSLYEKSLDMSSYEWQDGFAELAKILEAPDFVGFAGEPGRVAKKTLALPNKLVAAVLAGTASIPGAAAALDFYKNTGYSAKTLFDDAHPVNIFDSTKGSFDNNLTVATASLNANYIGTLQNYFSTLLDPSGEFMGLALTDVIVPPSLEQQFKIILESDLMYNATLANGSNTMQASKNIYQGAVNLIVAPELTGSTVFYAIDRNGPPFAILQDGGGTPEEIVYDKTSEMYKNTGKVGVKYVLSMACKAALPHAVAKITIT
jgi:hypothetical protein